MTRRKHKTIFTKLLIVGLVVCTLAGCKADQGKEQIIPLSFLEKCTVSVYNLRCRDSFDRITVTEKGFAKSVADICSNASLHRDLVLPLDMMLGDTPSALCNLDTDNIRYEISLDKSSDQLSLSGEYRDRPVIVVVKYVYNNDQMLTMEWGRYYTLTAADYAKLYNLLQSCKPDGSTLQSNDSDGRFFWEKGLEYSKLYIVNTTLDPGTSRRTVPEGENKDQILSLIKKATPFRPVTEADLVWSQENDKDYIAAELESLTGDIKVRISLDDWKTQLSLEYRYRETPVVKIERFDEGFEVAESWYYVMQPKDYVNLLNLLAAYSGGICE